MRGRTFGNGTKNIVFLHGWGGDASAFLFCARELAAEYRCSVVDFSGFGGTEEPARPYGVGDYADEILAYMDTSDIEEAVLVGHSFGGRVALEIAAKHPERAIALALVDSAGLRPKRRFSYYAKVLIHKILRKLGLRGLGGSKDYRELSPLMKETFKLTVNYDQTYLLKDIVCPTAVFWGKDDEDTPPYMARIFAKGIKDSHVFWLNGGHFAYLQDSAKFTAVLTAFVKGIYGGGKRG